MNEELVRLLKNGDLDALKELEKQGVNMSANCDGVVTLVIAAEIGNVAVVEYLLKIGNFKEAMKSLALYRAAMYGNLEVVKFLVKEYRILDPEAVIIASENGHKNVVEFLIDSSPEGASIFDGEKGATILVTAICNGYDDLFLSLLEKYNPSITAETYDGFTPWKAAVNKDNENIIKALLERKADINQFTDSYGKSSAIHDCLWREQFTTAKFLLARGARVDLEDVDYNTPLDILVRISSRVSVKKADFVDMARALLAHGASYIGTEHYLRLDREVKAGYLEELRSLAQEQIRAKLWEDTNGESDDGDVDDQINEVAVRSDLISGPEDDALSKNPERELQIVEAQPQTGKLVRAYYSNDDVMILLDGLLKQKGLERIKGGNVQDIVRSLQTGENTRTMVLAPIAENSEEAIAQMCRDIDRAYNHNIEQILVPVNIPNLHWYTIQLQGLEAQGEHSLEAIVHDSLGIRKSSVIIEKLVAQGIAVTSQLEGNLQKIQRGEFGATNVYCGGYTARLIANLALDPRIADERAWGCLDNRDDVLRQEDLVTVNEHNSANAVNFGKESIAAREVISAAQEINLLRDFIAEEKKLALLKAFGEMPIAIKPSIRSFNMPRIEDSAGLFALVRDLYNEMPSVFKVLFQVNANDEIEKDAQGWLKLDTNIGVEHIREIVAAFQTACGEYAESNKNYEAAAEHYLSSYALSADDKPLFERKLEHINGPLLSKGSEESIKLSAMIDRTLCTQVMNQMEDESGSGSVYRHDNKLTRYHKTAMDILLPLRLSIAGVTVGKTILWKNKDLNAISQSISGTVLEATAFSVASQYASANKLFLPILYKQADAIIHWVGMVIESTASGIQIEYLDSENAPMPSALLHTLLCVIEPAFHMVNNNKLPIVFAQQMLEQQRYNNCGPELIENFAYYLTGMRATQEGAIYLHSLLLENTLLDPTDYQSKIAENTKLIGLLSNTAPIPIEHTPILQEGNFPVIALDQAMDALPAVSNTQVGILFGFFNHFIAKLNLDFEFKKTLYHSEVRQFNNMLRIYNVKTATGSQASISILKDYSAFKKSVLLKLHPDKGGCKEDFTFAKELEEKFRQPIENLISNKIQTLQLAIHKTNLGFKALDFTLDVARLMQEPTPNNLNKAVFSYAHLHSLRYGVNGFSTVVSSATLAQQIYQGEYSKALVTASIYMALPFVVARINNPYITFAHSIAMTGYIGYSAITNAYSFCFGNNPDFPLSSTTAYKDLFNALSKTPLQLIYNFSSHAKKYELQINDMLFEREKLAVQSQLAEKGEFGKKVFDYIYLPALTEKYTLLNEITRGTLTSEEAEASKTNHIAITSSARSYDHCMEMKPTENINSTDARHYYCYDDKQQLLEHILIGNDNHFEVVERL